MTKADSGTEATIQRFSLHRRLEHQFNAILFLLLVVTGLAQKYNSVPWAEWIVVQLGGIDMTRLVHRYAGLIFAVVLIQHLVVANYRFFVKRESPSIVINLKDFTDAVVNLRYYFGISDQPARCDRYDYRQKFEYWGVVLGGSLMVVTGLMLWFPIKLLNLLPILPGQVIPAAKVAHSNEATLALLIIIIWHIYNAVFSPEVFPLDTSIFTGRISVKRMLHEHPLEYERIIEKPDAQDSRPKPEKEPTDGDPQRGGSG